MGKEHGEKKEATPATNATATIGRDTIVTGEAVPAIALSVLSIISLVEGTPVYA
jgi:hypothetical protein